MLPGGMGTVLKDCGVWSPWLALHVWLWSSAVFEGSPTTGLPRTLAWFGAVARSQHTSLRVTELPTAPHQTASLAPSREVFPPYSPTRMFCGGLWE